jgi:hypothetical protein
VTRFNIAFGFPQTDVCATCERWTNKMKIPEQKETAAAKLALHKALARHFVLSRRKDSKERTTLVLAFDVQQNMPLPRTNITEAFYKRQLWLYNFGIVVCGRQQTPKGVYFYLWLESQSARGSNKIVSALLHFLDSVATKVWERKYRKLSLYCDACPAQNKNYTFVVALLQYVNSPQCPFNKVQMTFPIRGHSYMEPDQVFSRVEKNIRQHKTILLPSEYHTILKKHGTLCLLGQDWNVSDYHGLIKPLFVQNPFPMQKTKRWVFQKGCSTMWTSFTYTGKFTACPLLKKKISPQAMRGARPLHVPQRCCVKAPRNRTYTLCLLH